MGMVNCLRCGKAFVPKGEERICRNCRDLEEGEYRRVTGFLQEHSNTKIEDIKRETGVDERTILRFLKEGRLSVKGARNRSCENCGAPIEKGVYCEKCSKEIAKKVKKIKRR